MYIPENKIIRNQYTIGKDFVLNNTPYIGYYNQIGNRFYTGSDYTDDSVQLTSLKEFLESKIKEKVKFNSDEEFFVKKSNDNSIMKVGVNEYSKYLNNPLYTTVKINKADPQSIEKAISILPGIKNLI